MRKRRYTGAVVTAACLLLYYGAAAVLFAWLPSIALWARLLLCSLPVPVCALVVFVLVQRVRELRSGETDDLDRY